MWTHGETKILKNVEMNSPGESLVACPNIKHGFKGIYFLFSYPAQLS